MRALPLLLLLVLVRVARADDPAPDMLTPGINLPVAPAAEKDKPDQADRLVVINLDGNGRLTMAGGAVTLRDIEVVLIWHRDHLEKTERKRLRAAGKTPPKPGMSNMRVLDGVLKCWSPGKPGAKPPFYLPIALTPTDLRKETYGAAKVVIQRAYGARFVVGAIALSDRKVLRKHVARILSFDAAKDRSARAGIKIERDVPFSAVAGALELLRKQGVATVSFRNVPRVPDEIRNAPILPYPKRKP